MINFGPFNHVAEPDDPRRKDEQEAHSRRYGASPFMVMKLASGRIAILGHMRELHAICDTVEEMWEAGYSIPMNVLRRSSESKKVPMPERKVDLGGIDLGSLDLDI